MMQIHKPTHKVFDASGTPAIGLFQKRGRASGILSRLENGIQVESVRLLSIGTETLLEGSPESLAYIWHFYFGETGQSPIRIEPHK